MEIESFDIATLFDETTESTLIAEATRPDTVITGAYPGTIKKIDGRISNGEKSPFPGRKILNCRVELMDDSGKKIATKFVEVSFEEYREIKLGNGRSEFVKPGDGDYSKDLPLDKRFQRWASIEKAVNPQGTLSIGQVVQRAQQRNWVFYVIEGFTDQEGGLHFYTSPKKDYDKAMEERKEMLKEGWTPKNYVVSIGVPKEDRS